MLVEEYLKNRGIPTTATEAPDILAQDDAEVSLETEITNSSADVTLDQSNNGFSLVNLHWASFSTGLSSVLAVVVVCVSIAACCYCKGRRQRQSRSRHSQLLHALSSTAQHVSTPARPQSGAYPMPPASSQLSIESTSKFPVARIPSSASSAASCGLPGCSTSYERPATVLLDPAGSARFFPIAHDALQAISHVCLLYTSPSPRDRG